MKLIWNFLFATAFFFLLNDSLSASANDNCTDAILIDSFPAAVNGDTRDATSDFPDPADNFRNLTCGIKPEGRGIWYRIVNKDADRPLLRARVVALTNVRLNTAIFVDDSGYDDCIDMECMLPRQYQIVDQRVQPTSIWYAKKDVSYFFHVTGIAADQVGLFSLDVTALDEPRPSNDRCDNAEMLSMGTTVSGDSMGALPHEMGDIYGTCSLHEYARGLFYKVDGTGKKLGVTLNILDDVLHSSQEEKTLEVAILDGCSIRNDIPAPTVSDCITFSDFLTADDTPHTVEFDSEKDITYYVVVSGQSFSDVGKFEISVEETSDAAGFAVRSGVNLVYFGSLFMTFGFVLSFL